MAQRICHAHLCSRWYAGIHLRLDCIRESHHLRHSLQRELDGEVRPERSSRHDRSHSQSDEWQLRVWLLRMVSGVRSRWRDRLRQWWHLPQVCAQALGRSIRDMEAASSEALEYVHWTLGVDRLKR